MSLTADQAKATVLKLLNATGLPVVLKRDDIDRAEGTIDGLAFKASWRPSKWAQDVQLHLTVHGERVMKGERSYMTDLKTKLTRVKREAEEKAASAARAQRCAVIERELLAALGTVGHGEREALLRRAVTFAIEHRFLQEEDARREQAAGAS